VNPALVIGGALAAAAVAYLLYKLYEQQNAGGAMAFAAESDAGGGDSGGSEPDEDFSPATAPARSAPSGVAMQWNDAIAQAASNAGIDPALLKAIAATETNFNPNAINPEKDFMVNGVSYKQYDSAGQRALVAWIKAGNEPALIGLNPSLGIAQVRVGNAKTFISGLHAWDLFDPATCFLAAAFLIRDDGTDFDTLDMYNVGNGSNWARGVRNLPYRAKAQSFYTKFVGDF
jgi:hypothetical protein